MTESEREALTRAAIQERRVRRWRRFQAVLQGADGQAPTRVALTLGCSRASVYNWLSAWRATGLAGLVEAAHVPPPPPHRASLEAVLSQRLVSDPQQCGHHATGWTVPLLQDEAAQAGIVVSESTIRRTLHRLGWRWKRPKYVLGRPDPAYAEKKGA